MQLIELKPKENQICVPSSIESMMTGVFYVEITRQLKITLHYTDGKKETARATKSEFEELNGSIFSLTSFVQGKRKVVSQHIPQYEKSESYYINGEQEQEPEYIPA